MSIPLTKKDFVSDQEVRWCPGCGDYAVLAAIQKCLPELGIPRENIVFVSGIGCSSRFPYYMQTYGFHTIHGRPLAVATGLAIARPDLSIWVVTGDGDGLSIGGNHLLHTLRRNINLNILLFNNQTYGLTKGQYSPTSHQGTLSRSTPFGSLDMPVSAARFALGAGASFVARTYDKDQKHMMEIFRRAAQHQGSSFVEIYQNCVIFNDDVFEDVVGKDVRSDKVLFLEHGKPLLFGKHREKGICFSGLSPQIIEAAPPEGGYSHQEALDGIAVHNEKEESPLAAFQLTLFAAPDMPEPMGIFRAVERPVYEREVERQEDAIAKKLGRGNLQELLRSGDTWEVS